MLIRPAFPDELGRAQSLLQGHPTAPGSHFLLCVKEQPIERIIATIPWFKAELENEPAELKFSIHSGNTTGLSESELDDLFAALEELAQEEKAPHLTADFPLVEEHSLFQKLTDRGYAISQTETFISADGNEAKSHFLAQKNELPNHLRLEPIRGHSPESFYQLATSEGALSPKQFKAYWDGASRERFEGDLSHLILAGEKVIAILLITQQGSHGLNIRIESISPDYEDQAELLSNALHQAAFQNCPDDFPQLITWSRQTQSSYQNGKAHKPRHTLSKTS